ncbi:MAG TPA: di-heme oxidoredictase family protein [Bacteroidia bacterium]|jgi:CxxC motif-containing protein (DUF1111 family)|nr:di-heme oxidoredictase family protein [Bacteroidia bacterium]
MKRINVFIILLILIILGCKKIMPPAPNDSELLDGPVEGLTAQEKQQFLSGDVAFNDDIFTPKNGLGPIFVANSCGSCHAGDGKGHPFAILTRFGQTDTTGNEYLQLGGPQLQNRAIPGYTPEQLPAGVGFSKILAPANTGLGFLDAISDATILAQADPADANGDGISGVPNWIHVPAYCQFRPGTILFQGRYIGRYGKKAGAYDLLQQTANAYNQDMGINSAFEPYETYSKLEVDPEVSNTTIYNVVFYLKTLKAPIQRNQGNEQVQAGVKVFRVIGCNKCHTEEYRTGEYTITALANKVIRPYTDLLLHDMGPGLDDHYTEGYAKTAEWKTPALWGLGLAKKSQGGSYFLLHDGRAHSIEEAILLHGGEGQKSKNAYMNLTNNDKANLLKFLESL